MLCFMVLLDNVCGDDEAGPYWYDKCAPQSCGGEGPNISFPFYIEGKQDANCGYSELNPIRCGSKNVTLINLSGVEYVLKDIDYRNRSLRVIDEAARLDRNNCSFWELKNWSGSPQGSPVGLLDNQTRLHLFYGCNAEELRRPPIECDNIKIKMAKGKNCSRNITVPLDQWKDNMTKSELQDALSKGFVLNWAAPDCNECHDSGGRCGVNVTTHHFRCYCLDRPHSRSCKHGKLFNYLVISNVYLIVIIVYGIVLDL